MVHDLTDADRDINKFQKDLSVKKQEKKKLIKNYPFNSMKIIVILIKKNLIWTEPLLKTYHTPQINRLMDLVMG